MKRVSLFFAVFTLFFILYSLFLTSSAHAAAPTISLGSTAATVSAMQSTVSSTVSPNGVTTTTFFLWGKTNPGLGQSNCSSATFPNVTTSQTIPSNYPATPITSTISGLVPGVTYYYCAVAYNSTGVAFTPVNSFVQDGAGAAGGCPSVPLTTDYTAPLSCKFANPTVDGVDKGSGTSNDGVLTIAKDTTLTVSAGQTVAYGILYKPGATLTRIAGGSVRRGAIWSQDTDGDGYPDYGDVGGQTVASTQPAGYIRRTTAATRNVDCAVADPTKYQNVSGYVDVDGDGYTVLAASQPVCLGASYASSGFSSTSSGIDCDDSSLLTYQTQTVGTDADQDGYSVGGASAQCVGASSIINGRTYYKNGLNASVYVAQANIIATNECNDTNASYGSTCSPYNVSSTAAGSVGTGSAILNSTINPNNTSTSITYRYQTGSTATCNVSTPASTVVGPSSLTGTADLSGATTQQSLTGLIPNQVYYFCATANNTYGTGYASSVLNFTTSLQKPFIYAQGVTSIATTTASLTSTVNPNNASTTIIYRYSTTSQACSSHGTGSTGPIGLTGTANISPNATSITGLTGNTIYYYCATANNGQTVNSVNDGNNGTYSFLTLPGSPTSPSTSGASATSLTVSWTAPAGGAASYDLIRWVTGQSAKTTVSGFTSGSNDTGLTCATSYSYAVRAKNATGSSDSVTFSGTTGACASKPYQDVNGTIYAWGVLGPSTDYGWEFTPTHDGTITELWGYVGGTETVELWNRETGVLLASGSVVSNGVWTKYTIGSPVSVTAGTVYSVSATTTGSPTTYYTNSFWGGNIYSGIKVFRGVGGGTVSTAQKIPVGILPAVDFTYVQGTDSCHTLYSDADNDGYGVAGSNSICSGVPAGTNYVNNTTDCYNSNANAFPNQNQGYSTDRGDGSFDYNCDASISYIYSYAPFRICNSVANTAAYYNSGTCTLMGTFSNCTSVGAASTQTTCGGYVTYQPGYSTSPVCTSGDFWLSYQQACY